MNSPCSPNLIPLPVVAVNEPCTFKLEFSPKIIPLGLIKYKLAAPLTPNVPKIFEGLLPVTREKILFTASGLAKKAPLPSPMLNS